MQLIKFDKVSKSFNGKVVFNDISFAVEQGSFVSIFGPNASGKTTLLNIISGILNPDTGHLIWENEWSKNKISYVFQNYRETLFPWKNIEDNLALPLKLKGYKKSVCKEKVLDLVNRFSISIDLEKYPYQLSGGQQQLVAILRAIITEPELLLLDEPFSALDFQRRIALQSKVLEIWEQTKTTIIFVSHDIDEAIYLADKVILLGNIPASIETVETVNLMRPRTLEMLNSTELIKIREKLMRKFISHNSISI